MNLKYDSGVQSLQNAVQPPGLSILQERLVLAVDSKKMAILVSTPSTPSSPSASSLLNMSMKSILWPRTHIHMQRRFTLPSPLRILINHLNLRTVRLEGHWSAVGRPRMMDLILVKARKARITPFCLQNGSQGPEDPRKNAFVDVGRWNQSVLCVVAIVGRLGITRGVVGVHRLSVDRYNGPLMASVVVFICFLCSRSSSMVMSVLQVIFAISKLCKLYPQISETSRLYSQFALMIMMYFKLRRNWNV